MLLALAANASSAQAEDQFGWTGAHLGIGVVYSRGTASGGAAAGGYGNRSALSQGQSSSFPYEGIRELNDWCADHQGSAHSENFCYSGAAPYPFDIIGTTTSGDVVAEVFSGMVEAGYDIEVGRSVLGAAMDASIGGSESTDTAAGVMNYYADSGRPPDGTSIAVENSLGLGNSVNLIGRAGFLLTERNLVYGLVGISSAEIALSSKATVVGDIRDGSITTTTNDWHTGFVSGVGIESMIGDHFSAKLEYRYASYEDLGDSRAATASCANLASPSECVIVEQADSLAVHAIRAVLSYRF